MAVARRRFITIALQSTAVWILPALKLVAPVVPCLQAVRSRFSSIPIKRLSPNGIRKPGRWGG